MMEQVRIQVVVVDDHRRIHEQVTAILATAEDIEIVAQASNGEEAVAVCLDCRPDIVLMDVVMPHSDGAEATRRILDASPETKVLVLSSFQDDESVHSMLRSGASGYVTKRDIATKLISSIRTTHLGHAVFSSEVATRLVIDDEPTEMEDFGLTDRELQVLQCMADGMNNREIAYQLTISRSTVNFHVANIVRKMRVETRAEALVAAAKNGLV